MNTDYEVVIRLAEVLAAFGGIWIVATTVVASIILLKSPENGGKLLISLIGNGNIIRLTTVGMIIVGVLILRFFDKISPEATIATLSGIAGYVLGGENRLRRVSPRTDENSN